MIQRTEDEIKKEKKLKMDFVVVIMDIVCEDRKHSLLLKSAEKNFNEKF